VAAFGVVKQSPSSVWHVLPLGQSLVDAQPPKQ
jgi:hypothetical protein